MLPKLDFLSSQVMAFHKQLQSLLFRLPVTRFVVDAKWSNAANPDPLKEMSHFGKARLLTLCMHLCQQSYQPTVQKYGEKSIFDIKSFFGSSKPITVDSQLGQWTLVAAKGSNLSLWKISSPSPQLGDCHYAVAFRGTKHWDDVLHDHTLTISSVSSEFSDWDNLIAGHVEIICKEWFIQHKITGPILFTGHSLGAAFAESAYSVLHLQPTLRQSICVTFDSPGIPPIFRKGHNVPEHLPGVLTLLADQPNIVNTLNVPTAADGNLYVCGNWSSWRMAMLLKYTSMFYQTVSSAFSGGSFSILSTLRGIAGAVQDATAHNMKSHSLDSMQTHLDAGRIALADPKDWPIVAHQAAKTVLSSTPSMIKTNNKGDNLEASSKLSKTASIANSLSKKL